MKALGIDIGGTYIKSMLLDEAGDFVPLPMMPTRRESPESCINQLRELIGRSDPTVVGIGTAGSVNGETGRVNAANLGWKNVPLARLLEDATGRPVWVDNDAQAALMTEWQEGCCRGLRDVLLLTLGTGVGGAAILNGQPWRGHANLGCEFGHMTIEQGGALCGCSRRGCLEAYASARALSMMGGGRDPVELLQRAAEGEPQAREVAERYFSYLASGIASLFFAFNPEMVVLGGGLSLAGDALLDGVQEAIAPQFASRPYYQATNIVLATHQNDAGAKGAALLARYYAR